MTLVLPCQVHNCIRGTFWESGGDLSILFLYSFLCGGIPYFSFLGRLNWERAFRGMEMDIIVVFSDITIFRGFIL